MRFQVLADTGARPPSSRTSFGLEPLRAPSLQITLFLFTYLFGSGELYADQLQCNGQEDADEAAALLEPGTLMIDYCSLCEAKAVVVKVASAKVVNDCEFEVEVSGTALAETGVTFGTSGYDRKKAEYTKQDKPYSQRVDLAYAYVETAPNVFRWLGGELGLKADVNTRMIRLPPETYEELGEHKLSSILLARNAEPPPSVEAIKQVWHHYLRGQGRPPILVEAKACLEIDRKKGSETRLECTSPVEEVVPKGTLVYLWSAWFLTRGEAYEDLYAQYLHEGLVRTTKDIRLKGGALRTRNFVGSKLRKTGRWTIIVRRGDEPLTKMELTVE